MQNPTNGMPYDSDKSNLEILSNEFAMVRFGKVKVGNGERLLIQVPSSGDFVLLDPIVLEAIAELGHDELSQLLVKVSEE
ncbi:hypothetical protein ACSFXN_05720 [Planococcus sp. 1R117A]|uniref:hypothetical protein n=1 Tax=Planococcus sp. 1R117A TaxID=3447020 RepID=UPI003EDC60C8